MHAFPEGFDPFFTEIQDVYDEIGESYDEEWPPPRPELVADDADEIEASGLFDDVHVRRYVWARHYTADEYIALLDTFSGHIAMEHESAITCTQRSAAHRGACGRARVAALVRNPPRRAAQDPSSAPACGRSRAHERELW